MCIRDRFCALCAARLMKWRKLGRPLVILAAVIAFAITLWFDLSKWAGCWLAMVLVLPTVWLTDYRDRVVRIKRYDTDKVTFEFKRSEYAQQFGRGLDQASTDTFVGMYVNQLTLDYGVRGRAAVERFFDEAYEHKLIPSKVKVEFV